MPTTTPSTLPQTGEGLSQAADSGAIPPRGLRTVGLALFIAWAMAALSLLFPASAHHDISPLFVCCMGAVALIAFCWYSYRTDAGSFTFRWTCALAAAATIAAVVANLLVASGHLPSWGAYAAAAILGFSTAALAFVWAMAFAGAADGRNVPSAMLALFLASALDYVVMGLSDWGIAAALTLFLAASCACLVRLLHATDCTQRPVLIRPRNSRDFMAFGIGATLFAVALGIVGGTTADVSSMESAAAVNTGLAQTGLIVSGLAFAGCALVPRYVEPMGLLKVLVPAVILVMLANVVDFSQANQWLTLTLFAWPFLLIGLSLVVVAVDRARILSLPMAFPAVWAVLWGGYGLGVLLGQTVFPGSPDDTQAITNSIVAVASVAVVASVFLFSSRLSFQLGGMLERPAEPQPIMLPAPALSDPAERAASRIVEKAALAAPEESEADPCERLAAFYKLSARESEVFALLAQGHTRAAIAKKLFVSENTVREHVKNIYKKLHIHSRQQLIDLVDARRG